MKVFVGSCIWRTVEARHISSLIPLLRSPGFSYGPQTGDALIERARSKNASWFIKNTDADIHLSIDSDIADFRVEDVQKICEQAMTHDIVVGLYVTRAGNQRPYPTSMIAENIDITMGLDKDDLVPVEWGATGFMATHRRVFESLANGLPLLHKNGEDGGWWPFYQTMIVDYKDEAILLSEDYAFCERAKRAGFGIWANPGVRLGHVGQYPYRMEDMAMDYPPPQPLVLRREAKSWTVRSPDPIAAEAVPL